MLILKPLSIDWSVAGANIPAVTFIAQTGLPARELPVQRCYGHARGPIETHVNETPRRQQPRPVTVVGASELQKGWQPLRMQHFAIERYEQGADVKF